MKAKLIKREDGLYSLYDENGKLIYGKLSIKNCQAIERGYDLDELAENYGIENGLDLGCFDEVKNSKTDFKSGFQKAIELLGGKKFSEYDMTSIFEYGWNQRHYEIMDEAELEGIKNRYIQSLQQTEWDVTFNLEKLDADGCLILKTFKSE
jgi:hypothetical protein